MLRHARALALGCAAVAVLLVAGCATVPKQSFDRGAHADIKVIGLLEPHPTLEYAVINVGHVGNAFGLIGALVATADIQGKTTEFTAAMKSRGFDLAKEYRDAMRQALESRGYVVKVIPVDRPRGFFLDYYDGLDPTVDAYFDSNIGGAYLCASATSDYLPSVRSNTRVVKRRTREVVYQEIVSYGYESRIGAPVMIASGAEFRYADHAALMANADRALVGLRNGIPLLVDRTVRDLSR
jgi:hypothetical protein